MTEAVAEGGITGVEIFVARAGEIGEGERKLVRIEEWMVGVFRWRGRYYAYKNRCAHQGGPVCLGVLLGKVEAVLSADRDVIGERFSEQEMHLVCPWHGYEYEISTGICAAAPELRLTAYPVVEREDGVYVRI